MAITVREAQERDIDLLVEMKSIVHDLHVTSVPTYFKQPEPVTVAEFFRSRLRDPQTHVWIASAGESPVGYAVSILREQPETPVCLARRFCELDEIAVRPARRREGVARVMVERVLADARARGVRDAELTCWSFNADAQAAFEALGFRPMTVRLQRESE